MSVARLPRTAPYLAERTETGWRITLPLESVPSANRTTREHWRARKRRVDGLTGDLIFLRSYVGGRDPAARPYFERATLRLTLYFTTTHRRDPGNYGQGAGAKSLVDALVHAGWLHDDDAEHLTCAEPVLCVDRERPRVEVELMPWNGVR